MAVTLSVTVAPRNVDTLRGWEVMNNGATPRVTEGLVTTPNELITNTEYNPALPNCALFNTRTALVAPGKSAPLNLHW